MLVRVAVSHELSRLPKYELDAEGSTWRDCVKDARNKFCKRHGLTYARHWLHIGVEPVKK